MPLWLNLHDGRYRMVFRVHIIQGAFRYTAGLIGSGFKQRRTLINTTTAVLGVRGTDLWGRVDSGDTFFLLIEGKVSLKPKRGAEIEYNNAGAAVDISYSKVSQPEYLSSDNISSLAQETEIEQ